MDRLDYLRRDSFYTGVTEGNIGSARIIKMLDVKRRPSGRRIQRNLLYRKLPHCTPPDVLAGISAQDIGCIREDAHQYIATCQGVSRKRYGFVCFACIEILLNDINREIFYNNPDCLENYIQLDDNDIWTALKVWSTHPDRVLSTLSMGMVNRNIFKVEISTEPFSEERKEKSPGKSANSWTSFFPKQVISSLPQALRRICTTRQTTASTSYTTTDPLKI